VKQRSEIHSYLGGGEVGERARRRAGHVTVRCNDVTLRRGDVMLVLDHDRIEKVILRTRVELRVSYRLTHLQLDGKYFERVQIPAKTFLSPTLGNTCHTYYFAAR